MIATQLRLAKVLEVVLAAGLVTGVVLTLIAWLWLGVKQQEATLNNVNTSGESRKEKP